jgi:hypothetical protein
MVIGNNSFDLFGDLLGEEPRAAFFSFQDQFGQRSPNQRRYFQNQFSNIHNEFLGKLGQQLRQGVMPQQTFTDFLGGLPFSQRFASLPPEMRGGQQSRLSPRTAFNFFQ